MITLKDKSILVTGGAGFIGSHLVDKLIRENPSSITIIDNFFLGKISNLNSALKIYPSLKIYHRDAADYETMKEIVKKEKIDALFNLAILPLPASINKPAWLFKKNTNITRVACELARKNYYKTLIHYSSSEVYGTCNSTSMCESHQLNPTTPYAASKAATDLLVYSYFKTYGIDMSIVRPFNNYGCRQNEQSYAGIIPRTIKRILCNLTPTIYGDGNQTRDYIHVTDTANATIKIYNSLDTRGKIINIASGKEISVNTIINFIATQMGYEKQITYKPPRPGDVKKHLADISLAKKLIKFKPTIKFSEGLSETIKWYEKILPTRRF